MALNLDIIGKKSAPSTYKYSWKDTVLYALGVGAKLPEELDYVFEMNGPKVLPTFAVVPSFTTLIQVLSDSRANLAKVLHGEQKIVQHTAIPSSGELSTVGEVKGIYDKGKGALVVVATYTSDAGGKLIFESESSIFVRGEGGFGGDRGPSALAADPPDTAPDFEVIERTTTEQAALYRLMGDVNPLHISPQMAKMAGFDTPILHGLCTYGFAGRALVAKACDGVPERLRSFSARFSGVVFPGDELKTSGWDRGDGSWVIRTEKTDGTVVLQNSLAEVGAA